MVLFFENRRTLALLLVIVASLHAPAQEQKVAEEEVEIPISAFARQIQDKRDPFANPLIQRIHKRHLKGVDGDKDAVKKQITELEKLTGEQPENYLLLAYLGSAYTLRSRDVWWPPTDKLKFLKQGGAILDEAVAKDPKSIAVRFLRAINYISLPAIFGKRDEARADFKLIYVQLYAEDAPPLDAKTKQAIHYYTGLTHFQLRNYKEAKQILETGLKISNDPEWQKMIQKLLQQVNSYLN